MSSTTARKQAPRLARPAARYWKGKAPKGVSEAVSDSEEDEEQNFLNEEGDIAITGDDDLGVVDDDEDDGSVPLRSASAATKSMNIALKDVNISRDGKVIVAGREESGRTELEDEEESESEEEEEDGEGEEESDESSEEESESEEEQPKVQFRPVFIPKRARVTVKEREALAQDTEEALKKKEAEAEERRKQSHDLVAESIKRELLEKEQEENVPDVDDTDGVDPEGEFEAWRLRELGRIKKEKEEELRREEEREEIERRRALPEEQRLREDLEHAQKSRDEKPKGQQKFLQKYWHRGAFHQDEDVLKRHDFTEATESTVDVSMLPKVMQVRNFGKRGRTKYTHLVDQDTTYSSGSLGNGAKPGGKSTDAMTCFLCGGPHLKKDCPQNTGPIRSGANAAGPGRRQWADEPDNTKRDTVARWRDDGRDRPRDDRSEEHRINKSGRRGGRDRSWERDPDRSYRPSRRHSHSPSHSPSPRRDDRGDYYGRRRQRSRSRSVSPVQDKYRDRARDRDREKRRRLD